MSVINTMTVHEMADSLLNDEYASWTRLGAYALAEYLDDLSDDIGEPIEWDRVAVRCDFSECSLSDLFDLHSPDWESVAREFIDSGEWDPEEYLDDLRDHCGCVIHVVQGTNPLTGETDEDTFIIQDF